MRPLIVSAQHVIRALLDLVAALLGAYYSYKYAALARRLGLPQAPASHRRGLLVIQIDGLAHTHLQQALTLGYAPYLARLLRREYQAQPWRTGIPCTTPSTQAGIMFGANDDIPAFRWFDKALGQTVVCSAPADMAAIQERLSRQHRGLLAGGSSYMNMFDGDASLAMFTIGALHRRRFFENVRGLGFVLLFLLNPLRTARTIALALWEYATELFQANWARLRQRTPRPFGRVFPFLRVMSNVVFREIETFAVMVDIYRGVPAIYTTYYGYDEVAHQYGVLSKPALRALRAIDARIRQIDRLRRLALTREYDLFVLSDHGMTPAEPFRLRYGRSLGDLLQELVGASVPTSESLGAKRQDVLQAVYLQEELATIAANASPPLSRIAERLRASVARRAQWPADGRAVDELPPDLARRSEIVVRSSGPLAHVYFTMSAKQLRLSEVLAYYPALVSELAAHPGIGLVVGREEGQVIVVGREGMLTLGAGEAHIEGQNPLQTLPQPAWAARQLLRLAHFGNSGDLILLGRYAPPDAPAAEQIACFEDQWACHGGLGGPQGEAFLLAEHNLGWNLDEVEQATELYGLFSRRYSAAA